MATQKFASPRAQAIAMLRDWAADQVAKGASLSEIHSGLVNALEAVVGEFRCQFDVPGVAYWHIPETGAYFTTMPGAHAHPPMRLARHEWLSRQNIHFGYEEDRL